MKERAMISRILIVGLICLAAPMQAAASDRVITLAALAFADYHQSVEMFRDPEVRELNPLLGPDPSRRDMAVFGVIGVATVALLERAGLPDWMIDSVVATERFNLEENNRLLDGGRRETLCVVYATRW